MIFSVDHDCWTPHRKILTDRQTHLPWLRTFGLQSVAIAREPLPVHIHPECMEIVFLLKGFQIYETEGQLFNLAGYDIFVTRTGEPHSSKQYPEPTCSMLWFQLHLSSLSAALPEPKASFLSEHLENLPRLFKGNADLEAKLKEAFFLLASPDPLRRFLGEELFLCCLYRLVLLSADPLPPRTDQISEAVVYIREHVAEPIRLEDVAAVCGFSLSRFKSRFKEETGTTPRAFINYVKIAQAKILLQKSFTVTRVADMLSFDTPNYFSTQFKKYTGLSPGRYQKDVLSGKLPR